MPQYATKTSLTTSVWETQYETKLLSPYLPEFHDNILAPLKERANYGADQMRLADDLFISLHPWLTRFIARKSYNLPAKADLEEIESRVHEAALLACRSIDWNRTDTFPSLLRTRVEGAVIEAARYDDWLSRRHRRMLNAFRIEIAEQEQHLGRDLSENEKREIAKRLTPDSARFDWESDLQKQFAPTEWNETFDNSLPDTRATPESACVQDEYVEIIHEWLESLPNGIGQAAYEWAVEYVDGHRGAPRPIMRKIKKYIPTLIEMLGSHMPEAGLGIG